MFGPDNLIQIEACFRSWIAAVSVWTEGQVVALDCKALRRYHDGTRDKAAIHMFSAWATHYGLVLDRSGATTRPTRPPLYPLFCACHTWKAAS